MHIKTPLIHSLPLSRRLNASVYLKLDNLQPSGSFKLRGIGHLCKTLKQRGIENLVSSSGGNAGLATAYASKELGMNATIVVPVQTPAHVVRVMSEEYGATVVQHGNEWSEAHQKAMQLVKELNHSSLVHPFDDPAIMHGHSTIVDELKEEPIFKDRPPSAILSVVGGGGLLSGLCEGLARHGWEKVPILAMETKGCHTFSESLRLNRQVKFRKMTSRAGTLAGNPVSEASLEYAKRFNVHSHVVTDEQAAKACCQFADDHRMLVELSCGAALSSIYNRSEPLLQLINEEHERGVAKPIIVVEVCGGRLVSVEDLIKWKNETNWHQQEEVEVL